MSETTKVINDIDILFSEISINGETFISENYVPDVPETAVIKVPEPAPEPEQVPVPVINVSGQNVSAVELNSVLHDIEDSEARENIRTKTDQLHTDIANNQALITNVENLLSSETEARQKADSALRADVESDINGIKELIPSQASFENKLADKEFVNSSVSTNTAYFKGTFNTLAELEAVPDVTNNDYGFVKTLDAAGNVVYNRYKYNAESSKWVFEYPLNNSSFTAEQWSAINSGITSGKIAEIDEEISQLTFATSLSHNIPRLVPKDITAYITDGSFWKRLAGTDGYALFEDIYVGDYFKMSRPISAYERTGQYRETGSQYVTIAGLDTMMNNGEPQSGINYHHAVMVPGQGFGGKQHFGRSRMNATETTEGGYKASEMNTLVLGEVTSTGSTAANATINQQLYAEFGPHLKTTRESVSSAINATGYNRIGSASGCSSGFEWISAQAILMSEIEVYGSIVWSSAGYDTGNANRQLPLFAFSKQAQNNRSAYFWFKDIASATHFCFSGGYGDASYYYASYAHVYVRPRFIIA